MPVPQTVARGGLLHLEGGQAAYTPVVVRYAAASAVEAIRRLAYPALREILSIFYGQPSL